MSTLPFFSEGVERKQRVGKRCSILLLKPRNDSGGLLITGFGCFAEHLLSLCKKVFFVPICHHGASAILTHSRWPYISVLVTSSVFWENLFRLIWEMDT